MSKCNNDMHRCTVCESGVWTVWVVVVGGGEEEEKEDIVTIV